MSRIGKRPVPVPSNVTATVDGQTVNMKGPKGELSFTVPDKIKVAKLNVDESSEVAMKYQVTSIPTFILFKNGEVADRVLGALPRSEFVKFLDRNL